MPFQNAWAQIQQIPINTQIPNWTVDNGYFGDPVTIIDVGNGHVTFDAQGAQNAQYVPQPDFAGVYDVWNDYINRRYPRHQIRDEITRFSRYIINTFQWLSVRNNGQLP